MTWQLVSKIWIIKMDLKWNTYDRKMERINNGTRWKMKQNGKWNKMGNRTNVLLCKNMNLPPDLLGCDCGLDIPRLRGRSSLLWMLGLSEPLDSADFIMIPILVSARCEDFGLVIWLKEKWCWCIYSKDNWVTKICDSMLSLRGKPNAKWGITDCTVNSDIRTKL